MTGTLQEDDLVLTEHKTNHERASTIIVNDIDHQPAQRSHGSVTGTGQIDNASMTGANAFISTLISRNNRREAAFDRLQELLNEAQLELSVRNWECSNFDRCDRAHQLRNDLWDAICDYRDACLKSVR